MKKAVRSKAFRTLSDAKEKHSKAKEIGYDNLSLQKYLDANSPLSLKENRFAFAVRSRGLNLKNNFKAGKAALNCRICSALSKFSQTQTSQPPYSDMFSQNIDELKQITELLLNKFTSFSIQVNRLVLLDTKVSIIIDENHNIAIACVTPCPQPMSTAHME